MVYKWYLLPIGGIIYHRSHLLREPGFTPLMFCSLHKKSTLWLLKASSIRHVDASIKRLKSQHPKNPNWLGLVFFFLRCLPFWKKRRWMLKNWATFFSWWHYFQQKSIEKSHESFVNMLDVEHFVFRGMSTAITNHLVRWLHCGNRSF